ncbi:hypothetical protein AKG11_03650 [Shinella sp. SUS2]|uniref:DUF4376 domain-containing protein n=1 Tax=unclassified Shinella TaxID=2643062 RepID=UPI000681BAB2|nr:MULTISPECIES: DUF4376 domain-containing protein [unclassified Shinella]KNY18238.1 hypothetical protein AKG11_03650 [Shinella sp. SUS2]KOC77433.1 hypothetical protein AKG10_01120 [Shinella sp. GWS1]
MTLYREAPGPFPVWAGEPIDGVLYQREIEQLWSAADLEAVGLWRDDMIAAAVPVPDGKQVNSTNVQRVEGVVRYVNTVVDIPRPTEDQVDAERDRRISGGFVFGGVTYQSRPEDRENITGASLAALAAMTNGAQPGNLRWHGGDSDFMWIAADNSTHPMDAQTVFAFGQTAMAHKQGMIFAARALKDADPIPLDYTDDAYWP